MSAAPPDLTAIEARFVAWAQATPAVRAACVIGSRARRDHPADAVSDLDLVVITTAPERLLEQTDWLAHLGDPWLTFVEPTTVGVGRERRVLFAGGDDVDLAVFSPTQFDAIPLAALARVFERGLRMVLDADGLLGAAQARCAARERTAPGPPGTQEYHAVVDDFWYHALWAARKLKRGELYTAKGACDGHMKDLLVQMLAWHAGATRGWATETWHRGRFLEEWAAPRALAELRDAYARYNRPDIVRALGVTMHLFGWIAAETATALGEGYASASEGRVVALVSAALASTTETRS